MIDKGLIGLCVLSERHLSDCAIVDDCCALGIHLACLGMLLLEPNIFIKLRQLDENLHACLVGQDMGEAPEIPARDVEFLPVNLLPRRQGLAHKASQQRLLHDLANIELQAMELGLRTLVDFPHAPPFFREQLAEVVRQEGHHLELCLQALESLGGYWGQWPVHLGLWHAASPSDTLLERVFIVHRYLEGAGLDAGDGLLRRISGINSRVINQVLQIIVQEEVGHVEFGSRWYLQISKELGVDPQKFYERLCAKLVVLHPRRDQLSYKLRKKALFSDKELIVLERLRQSSAKD
jgi:uncharacterized ferritin-like protein (DUF455 family)